MYLRHLFASLFLAFIGVCVANAGAGAMTESIPVSAGWNLLSLPVKVQNGASSVLFPSSVSAAYIFRQSAGYVAEDTLRNGEGFWLKFPSAELVILEGDTVSADTTEVTTGWNIIGGLSLPAGVSAIQTNPPGIIASQFFGYVPGGGYQPDTVLQPGRGYWVKAFSNGSVILQSSAVQSCPATVTYAGRIYNTVLVGTQCWLKENLDIGTRIDGSQNQTNNGMIEKYCYADNPLNCDTYGGLYQWDEAMQYVTTQGAQGICPPGWHIPTLAEFQTLSSAVSGDGNALKRQDQGSGSGQGTNTSGFFVLRGASASVGSSSGSPWRRTGPSGVRHRWARSAVGTTES